MDLVMAAIVIQQRPGWPPDSDVIARLFTDSQEPDKRAAAHQWAHRLMAESV
jgi:hypothetical protein